MATEVITSQKNITTRTTMKLLRLSFSRLNANMQSTSARQKNTRLNRIVIESILMSRPSSYLATCDLMLIEWVTVVSRLLPYLSMQIPRTKNDIEVNVLTHSSNPSVSFTIISFKSKKVTHKTIWTYNGRKMPNNIYRVSRL